MKPDKQAQTQLKGRGKDGKPITIPVPKREA